MIQKLISATTPEEFKKVLDEYLEGGWGVIPGTHVAQWRNVSFSGLGSKESTDGYFAIVVEGEGED